MCTYVRKYICLIEICKSTVPYRAGIVRYFSLPYYDYLKKNTTSAVRTYIKVVYDEGYVRM